MKAIRFDLNTNVYIEGGELNEEFRKINENFEEINENFEEIGGGGTSGMFRFEVSQTGTSDPTVKVLVNGLHVGYTLTRIHSGSYNLVFTSTAGYTSYPQNEPPLVIKDVGTILLVKKNATEYNIDTFDTNGENADGILDRLVVTIEFYKV